MENQYLTPIRNHTAILNESMTGCIRVCEDFESSKDRLMKLAHIKTGHFDDKFSTERVRDINLAYQKLKTNLFANKNLNQNEREALTNEIKKVQATIDRVLRGDR